MVSLTDLWLPILLSAVFVFVVSSILHMVLPIHRGDYGKLPEEESLLGKMRELGVRPGLYMFPCAGSMKELGTPEMLEKFRRGPVGYLTVIPSGPPAIGKSLVAWFLYSVVVGLLCAYLARLTLTVGADSTTVLRTTATAAFLAYGIGAVPESIWKGVKWSVTAKFVFDGLLYGLATGAAFAWLWPQAA